MTDKKTSTQDDRTRNWNLVVYPESAPTNWREILDEDHIAWIESPLHDKDENADGTKKKPHWHVLLIFEGKQSYEKVLEITKRLNTVAPQRCKSAKGSVRYMAHLDNPEKFQYKTEDIICHGGADIKKYLTLTAGDKYQCIKEMCEFVKEYDIKEFQDLMDYAMNARFDDWFVILCDCGTMVMSNYIKSQRHRHDECGRIVPTGNAPGEMGDLDTGKIINPKENINEGN